MMPSDVILSRFSRDPVLGPLITRWGPPTLAPEDDPDRLFARLARSIVSQQISVKVAARIIERLQAALPGGVITPQSLGSVSGEELRACGLSTQKARYLAGLAQAVLSGELDIGKLPDLEDEAVIEELVKVKGIGRWTAQMFLIFALCRPDVLPVGDLGLRVAIQRQYALAALPGPVEVERIAEPWRPYRTYATWYLWRSLDNSPPVAPESP